MDDILAVERVYPENDFGQDVFRFVLGQSFVSFEIVAEISIWTKIHQKVKLSLRLKGKVELDQKRMLQQCHDLLLDVDETHQVFFLDFSL